MESGGRISAVMERLDIPRRTLSEKWRGSASIAGDIPAPLGRIAPMNRRRLAENCLFARPALMDSNKLLKSLANYLSASCPLAHRLLTGVCSSVLAI
jgi:hypothetical protein